MRELRESHWKDRVGGLSKRTKFATRNIRLAGAEQLRTAMALLPHVPLDAERPLELVIREEPKARKLDQNSLMWVGPLANIAEQAWLQNRQFSAEVWHHFYKTVFLPEEFDAERCKEGYRKWDFTPSGERVLVGSTTQLTIKGFAEYLTQIEAHGASLGVQFTASPRREAA